jgi:NAD(P)-dependent dehydrogenase (short-subunit alcohol dehydrogenase family)
VAARSSAPHRQAFSTRMRLDGRRALVTGAAGHLGAATAAMLGELGASVAVSDRDEAGSELVVQRLIRDSRARVVSLPCDLRDNGAVRALPGSVAEQLGGLDILVNCAGMVGTDAVEGWTAPFEQQRLEPWELALRINLTAPFILCQTAAPFLRTSGHGSIVNVGSIYGSVGPDWRLYPDTTLGNPAGYAASKGGLAQLTRWLATTLAPEIRVNAVSPGGLLRGHSGSFLDEYVKRTPLRRMGSEDEVAGIIAVLAGDLSSYVTGQNILVDGGWTAW